MSSRKGQFYILISLLLIAYAFTLSRQDLPVRRPEDNFRLLHEGFVREGSVVVNNAVYAGVNVSERFEAFTGSYMGFAKSSEPGFRLVYLLKDSGSLSIGNRLDSEINVSVGNSSYAVSPSSQRIVAASDASFTLSGIAYNFRFSSDDIQLKAFFRSSGKLARRVFVDG